MKVGTFLNEYDRGEYRILCLCRINGELEWVPSRFTGTKLEERYWEADVVSITLEDANDEHPAMLNIYVDQNWEKDLRVRIYEL